jgi:hypothetical protein
LTAYIAPTISRVGRGVPAALANAAVGAAFIVAGIWGGRTYRKSPIPVLPLALAASLPWFITALQEAGVLAGSTVPDQVPNQVPAQNTIEGGLARGQIPGSAHEYMQGGLATGTIPGSLRMGRRALN